jgi:hypothetical protein
MRLSILWHFVYADLVSFDPAIHIRVGDTERRRVFEYAASES